MHKESQSAKTSENIVGHGENKTCSVWESDCDWINNCGLRSDADRVRHVAIQATGYSRRGKG